jgi:hypothetical protein
MLYTYLTGRNRTATDQGGRLMHAVPEVEGASYPAYFGAALCGAKPGRRSNGWSDYRAPAATCPKCLAALAAMEQEPAPDCDWKEYDHIDSQALADYWDGVSRGQHD